MKSSLLELLGCLKQEISCSYYTQESALADLYDSKGCFHPDSPLVEAFTMLQEETSMSGGDLLVLLFD